MGFPSTLCLLCIFCLVWTSSAAPEQDLIVNFPGIPDDMNHLKMYSGYLNTGTPRKLFYFLHMSENSPTSDPVMMWIQGGTICSGIMGSTWHGAFSYVYSKAGKPVVVTNPHRWTKVASMLYLEAAAGVGYSYATDGNDTTTDEQVASDEHAALKDFFRKFPELSDNAFYLFGESAGGTGVTALGTVVSADPAIKLAGVGLFSGVFRDNALSSMFAFLYYHGVIGTRRWQNIARSCCRGHKQMDKMACNIDVYVQQSSVCNNEVLSLVQYLMAMPINTFEIYSACQNLFPNGLPFEPAIEAIGILGPRCFGTQAQTQALDAYMIQPEVQTAMHVRNVPQPWIGCGVLPRYTAKYTPARQLEELRKLSLLGVKSIYVNGDADMIVTGALCQSFVEDLGFQNEGSYREWYSPAKDGTQQIAGFTQAYQHDAQYVSLKAAGHMVVLFQPAAMLQLVDMFIHNKPL